MNTAILLVSVCLWFVVCVLVSLHQRVRRMERQVEQFHKRLTNHEGGPVHTWPAFRPSGTYTMAVGGLYTIATRPHPDIIDPNDGGA